MEILGVDIGGSGIKGAPVDIITGKLVSERIRIPTPNPSSPEKVAKVLLDVVKHFRWTGPVGCGFPGVVNKGEIYTASNIDKRWLGTNASRLFSKTTGCDFSVINDADAAGIAEMEFGAGRDYSGVVFVITVGTGIGSALCSVQVTRDGNGTGKRCGVNARLGGIQTAVYAARPRYGTGKRGCVALCLRC